MPFCTYPAIIAFHETKLLNCNLSNIMCDVSKSPAFAYKINNLTVRYSFGTKPTVIICQWTLFPFLYAWRKMHSCKTRE
uniref:Putative ovule protein n=1 Tax=Solanum chacoense TaxID=4108 RepID=A0A0V0GH94_SOLCH